MKFLVVYDSIFGNTEKIARTIGNAVRLRGGGSGTVSSPRLPW